MPESYGQRALNQRTHIPQHVEAAMNQHMQQSMPAHLRKYMDQSKPTYVPQAAQKQISQYMEKSMPAHLKQYAGAYMEQRVAMPNSARPSAARQAPAAHAPTPDKLRLDHSAHASQYSVDPEAMPTNTANLFRADQSGSQPVAPAPSSDPQQLGYDFIMNPSEPPKRSLVPGASPAALRALLIAGIVAVLLILFVVLKGLFGGGSNFEGFVGVAQQQQAMLHLVQTAEKQKDLSDDNQAFAATAKLTLSSSQDELLKYLAKNHTKVNSKQINLKVSKRLDNQLEASVAAGTYNSSFQEAMKDKLNAYLGELKQTYDATKGQKGRALLSHDYDQARLLLQQLESAAND